MSYTPLPTSPNDAAFAKAAFYDEFHTPDFPQHGLTKREYFAAVALQGLLAYSEYLPHDCVVRSVKLADQLVIELNKTN